MSGLAESFARADLFMLIFLRCTALFITAPIWSNRVVPVQLRLGLAAASALVMTPLVTNPPLNPSLPELVMLATRELLVGLGIGFVAALIFAALQFAGQLLDIHMGLSMVNLLDPFTNTQMPIMGNFLYMLSLLFFLAVDGHHQLLIAFFESYRLVPLGGLVLSQGITPFFVEAASNLFVIGFRVAAPVVGALFISTVSLGILNRAVSQINVFIVGMPVQLAVGVFMLIVVMPLFVAILPAIFEGGMDHVWTFLRLLKG